VLDWGVTDAAPKAEKDTWSTKGLKLLRQAIMSLLVDCGIDLKPWADGPVVKALNVEIVRAEFYKTYFVDDATKEAKGASRKKAFKRAMDDAVARRVVVVREVAAVTYAWLATPDHVNPAENA
jgi:hypothetical protein